MANSKIKKIKIVKDDDILTIHGFWYCDECKSKFYGGGLALHERSCSRRGYGECEYHVGPNCKEYNE